MRTLTIELGERRYPIRIGSALLGAGDSYPEARGRRCRLVTDATVGALYQETLARALGLQPEHCLSVSPGEPSKTYEQAGKVLDWLLETRTPRDGLLIALGGGVVGDLAGFAAAVYQRGMDFIQVPTTLLAQVDSSVGGKTGVNHARGKNMIGAFHQPRAVIADLDVLRTLPSRELRSGIAEVIKYGMLGDAQFFAWLEANLGRVLRLETEATAHVVETCCAMKARIVADDEREAGARALLNLGHTFGHAIETHAGYGTWLHGEAVATGLCLAAELSASLGWMPTAAAERCRSLVEASGLPVQPPPDLTAERFVDLMSGDKKVKDGRLHLVLMRELGRAELTADVAPAAIVSFLRKGGFST